jgi:hypothetical protein
MHGVKQKGGKKGLKFASNAAMFLSCKTSHNAGIAQG